MKKNNKSLFYLIKSLSSNEKGYLKKYLYNVGNADSSYIKLFDAIDKQKEYNEKQIKEQFSNSKLGNHLNVTKLLLYKSILRSLRSYSTESTIEAELHDLFRDAEILFGHDLHEDCRILLQKILKIAEENEFFLTVLEVHYFFFRLRFEPDSDALKEKHKAELQSIQQHENLIGYRTLWNELDFIPSIFNIEPNKLLFARLNKILNHPLLSHPDKALSFKAKNYYYHLPATIWSTYLHDHSKSYSFNKKKLEQILSCQGTYTPWFYTYIDGLSNLMTDQLHLLKFSEYKVTLNKLIDVKVTSRFLKTFSFEKVILNETLFFIKSFQTEQGIGFIRKEQKEIKEYLEKSKERFPTTQISFNCSLICFIEKDFSGALRWINYIEAWPLTIRNDFELFIRLYRMLIHFELGNFDYIDNTLNPTLKYIEKFRNCFSLELLLIDFLKNSCKHDSGSQKTLLKTLQKALSLLPQDKTNERILQVFDIKSWCDAKIENKSFAEMLKKSL